MARQLRHVFGISRRVKALHIGPFHSAEVAFPLHFVVILSKPQSLSLHQHGLLGICSPLRLANL